MKTYDQFLDDKIEVAKESGFEISLDEINPALKPHQKLAVQWAVRGGRRGLFERFGLGKTVQELEFCRIVTEHEGGQAGTDLSPARNSKTRPFKFFKSFIDSIHARRYTATQTM